MQNADGPTILQVIPHLGAGGAEQTTIDMVAAIAAHGGRALVATRGGFRDGEVRDAGGTVIDIPAETKNPYGMLANVLRLAQIIDRDGVDLVHARSRAPAWSALAAARIMGVPFVTTYHGTYTARSGLKRFYNSGMVRGDAVIANSHFIAEHIAGEYGLALQRIDVIPRGIDTTFFDPDTVTRTRVEALRAAWGTALPGNGGLGNRKVLLLPGRLTRWKGQEVFLAALAHLKAAGEHEDWVGVLVGDDQGRDLYVRDLQAMAERFALTDRVVFHGHCDDMPAAYLAADLVVSPATEPEAFGRVPVEAQAMGRVVIASDHGGSRETMLDAGNDPAQATGWRVAPGDDLGLARTLGAALKTRPEILAAMGDRGRAFVQARYSLDAMTGDTLSVYDRVLRTAGRTRA